MAAIISNRDCSKLRIKCIVIGYLWLFVGIVDVVLHFFTVALMTRSFECDEDSTLLPSIMREILGPFLFILNLGTHGFYQFPVTYPYFYHLSARNTQLPTNHNCYPGMIHVNQIDVLNFIINVIWVKYELFLVRSVHRKDPDSIRSFYRLSIMKMMLQMTYCVYWPYAKLNMDGPTYWILALLDFGIAAYFLKIINSYIKELYIARGEAHKIAEFPPSYMEYTIHEPTTTVKKDAKSIFSIQPIEQKVDLSTNIAVGARA